MNHDMSKFPYPQSSDPVPDLLPPPSPDPAPPLRPGSGSTARRMPFRRSFFDLPDAPTLMPVASSPPELKITAKLTRVAAGFPSPADDYLEDGVDLNRLLVRNAPATFFYTVEKDADSMLARGIEGGDRLLVDRSIEPRSGHIVLAIIPGEGATVKELQIRGMTTRLVPHSPNPAHKARVFREGDELVVVGVVTSCIKQFRV